MLNGKYFSHKIIRERLASTGLDLSDLYTSDIIEWVGNTLRNIQSKEIFRTVTANGIDGNPPAIMIRDYKGMLPNEIINIELVVNKATGFAMIQEPSVIPPMYIDSMFNPKTTVNKFSIHNIENNPYIYVDFPTGEVDLIYTTYVVDDEGYPMIPDNESIINACVYYCAYLYARRLYIQDKLEEKKSNIFEREYLYYIAQANTAAKTFNRNTAEGMILKQSLINGGKGYPIRRRSNLRRRY